MKYRMLDLLKCPNCHGVLKCFSFSESREEKVKFGKEIGFPRCKTYCELNKVSLRKNDLAEIQPDFDCIGCYEREIAEGLLICRCGSLFPIMASVPRFISNRLESFPRFQEKHRNEIEKIASSDGIGTEVYDSIMPKEFESIHDSFSAEWNMFDYDRDMAWGWDLGVRKRAVLNDFDLQEPALRETLFLDAGCGNGALTAALVDFETEVVGLDISNSVVRAQLNKSRFAKDRSGFVHFVQGNLSNPPLARNSFDLIYSYGVLHHTPNTEKVFSSLVPMVKQGGRMYIWVYGKRGVPVRLFFWHGRWFRRHMSLKSLSIYCYILSPLYKVISDALSALRIYKFRKRRIREIALDLFDAFSPQYNHWHTREEVCGWFWKERFANITVSGVQKQGFGVYGDKA